MVEWSIHKAHTALFSTKEGIHVFAPTSLQKHTKSVHVFL